jgi:photosystem II stability/assembly factor-like uncharacterized protein
MLYSQTVLFQDNFDSYPPGGFLTLNSTYWQTWSNDPGGMEDALISSSQFVSGGNSLNIKNDNDIVYRLGSKISGKYLISFNMYISSANGAYVQLLHRNLQNTAFAIYFRENLDIGFYNGVDSLSLGSFTPDSWFNLKLIIDLDKDSMNILLDETSAGQFQFSLDYALGQPQAIFGMIDFYGLNNSPADSILNSDFFIDDFSFAELIPPMPKKGCDTLEYKAINARGNIGTIYRDLGATGSEISTSGNFDNANSSPVDIGFGFKFNCQIFTQFILNTNGFIKLGNTPPSSPSLFFDRVNSAVYGIFTSPDTADVNLIIPFNHDLEAGTGTPEYRVYTSGTAPNRRCVIQFKNLSDKGDPYVLKQYDNINFQIILYETSNKIEFVYGVWTPSVNPSAFKTASCGLKGSSIADHDLLVVNKGSAALWTQVGFKNENYFSTATLNFGNPPARPVPNSGLTFRFEIPQAPSNAYPGNSYIPFHVEAGTVVGGIVVIDPNTSDTHTLELVPDFGDNSLFSIESKNLVLKSDLNLTGPQDLKVKIKVTDNTGLSAEFESVIHANTDKYTIQNLDQSLTSYYTDEIIAINKNNVWVHGRNGEVARTNNGGQTWDTVSLRLSPESYFGPLFAIDSLTAWLVVSQGDFGIYKTTDGGLNWNKQSAGFTETSFPDLVYFWNKNEGFVLGDADGGNLNYLEIYTTTDGGDTWTRVPSDKVPPEVTSTVNTPKVLSVINDTAWVSASPGYILRSTDKGKTWTALDAPGTNQLGGLVFVNGKEGLFSPFSSGVKSLFITHNAGETWDTLTTNITVNNYYQLFSLIPGTQTIVMADNNRLYFSKDKGTTWDKTDILYPFLYGIDAANHNLLWASGEFNKVYRIEMLPAIEGRVMDPLDSPVTDGYVLLYQAGENMTLSVVDSVRIMSDGKFNFPETSPGKHLVLAVADPALYPDAVPTYYYDKALWSEALGVELDYTLSTNPLAIRLIIQPVMNGQATLSGNVMEGDLKAGIIIKSSSEVLGNPVKSAGVILVGRSKSGTIMARTITDENGYFEFRNVPVGEYDILIDIPGTELISYHTVTVTETDTEIPNLSFIVGTEGIIISSIGHNGAGDFKIYPNPTHGYFTIELPTDLSSKSAVSILDIQGRVWYTAEVPGSVLKVNTHLEKGTYFVKVTTPDEHFLRKLIIE